MPRIKNTGASISLMDVEKLYGLTWVMSRRGEWFATNGPFILTLRETGPDVLLAVREAGEFLMSYADDDLVQLVRHCRDHAVTGQQRALKALMVD